MPSELGRITEEVVLAEAKGADNEKNAIARATGRVCRRFIKNYHAVGDETEPRGKLYIVGLLLTP